MCVCLSFLIMANVCIYVSGCVCVFSIKVQVPSCACIDMFACVFVGLHFYSFPCINERVYILYVFYI